ncbi:MAG TPA: hypothetical protein VE131_05450 [Terriglobales bacterium]|nr:hypothetical protein [Terriglobales bacterium]
MQNNCENNWTLRPCISSKMALGFGALAGIGLVTFVISLLAAPMRAWQSYLINFLFWTGLAQGAVVFAAIYDVVGAKWGAPLKRLAEGMAAFLPVSVLLFLPLYGGLKIFFSRVHELNPSRGAWFDPRFIFVRGTLGLGLIAVLSIFFLYYSLRPEVGLAQEKKWRGVTRLHHWIAKDWRGAQTEVDRCQRGLNLLGAGVLLAYPIVYTFMAFDLIMALDPFWYSSLFGGYFFVSTFYLGLAGLAVIVVLIHWSLGDRVISAYELWDLGKLLLGFDLTYFAMAWAQYIVIWYGNLPEEIHFVIVRLWTLPWAAISWSALILSVLIPFLVFLSRQAKQVPSVILSLGIVISVGLWLERYVLVVPSLWERSGVPLGWIDIGITAGFLGALGLSYVFFLRNFPVVPMAQAAAEATSEKAVETTT